MATHSSTLAWRTPWREEPGRLQSMGSQRVGHDWVTSLHFTSLHCEFCIVRSKLMCCWETEMMQSIWWENLPVWFLVHHIYRSNTITCVQYCHMFRDYHSTWDGPTPTWRHALSWIQVLIILNRYRKICIYNNLIKWVGGQFFRKKLITDFPKGL